MLKHVLTLSVFLAAISTFTVGMAEHKNLSSVSMPTLWSVQLQMNGFSLPHSKSFTALVSCNDQNNDKKNYTITKAKTKIICPITHFARDAYEFELNVGSETAEMVSIEKTSNSNPEIVLIKSMGKKSPDITCTKGSDPMEVSCKLI